MVLLNITENDRTETVIIDGTEYSLTSFDDFSPTEQFRFKAVGARMVSLAEKDNPSKEEIAKVENDTDEMFQRIAGDIPEGVCKKLKPGARQRIITAFFLALGESVALESTELRSPSGQKKHFPSSSDSTEEAPATG